MGELPRWVAKEGEATASRRGIETDGSSNFRAWSQDVEFRYVATRLLATRRVLMQRRIQTRLAKERNSAQGAGARLVQIESQEDGRGVQPHEK